MDYAKYLLEIQEAKENIIESNMQSRIHSVNPTPKQGALVKNVEKKVIDFTDLKESAGAAHLKSEV